MVTALVSTTLWLRWTGLAAPLVQLYIGWLQWGIVMPTDEAKFGSDKGRWSPTRWPLETPGFAAAIASSLREQKPLQWGVMRSKAHSEGYRGVGRKLIHDQAVRHHLSTGIRRRYRLPNGTPPLVPVPSPSPPACGRKHRPHAYWTRHIIA